MLDFNLFAGKIIAFEGLDCSFKETNHKAFVERYKKEIRPLQVLTSTINDTHIITEPALFTESFPRYGNKAAYFVEQWLRDKAFRENMYGRNGNVDGLYALDRYDYWYSSFDNFLFMPKAKDKDTGDYVKTAGLIKNRYTLYDHGLATFIFDRYASSNAIYNPLGGQRPQIEDFEFDNEKFSIPKPDIVVWMRTGNFDVLKNLLAAKKNKDANELDLEFLERVWNNAEHAIYNNLFEKTGTKLIVVDTLDAADNIRSREDLAEEIWHRVIAKLYEIV